MRIKLTQSNGDAGELVSCWKLVYMSEDDAKRALRSAKKQHKKTKRVEKSFYKCPRCVGWHLTSQEQRPKTESN